MRHDNFVSLDTTTGLEQQGRAWVAKVSAELGPGDNLDALTASRLVLYEDDRELGPSHAQHEVIRQIGSGAYSHWDDNLYFSTSDGSDPRTNRRQYRVALRSLKVIVIALDGVDLQTLRQHIADGRLPAIAKILKQSREVEVRTECELFGVSCWPAFASGLSVGAHGIHAFRPLRSGTMQPVESTEFQMPLPFWEMAARAGISTCVLDVPHYATPIATSELEMLRYVEWGPHPPQRPTSSLPPDLVTGLIRRHGLHPCPVDVVSLPTSRDSVDYLACLCAGARKRAAVINDLIRVTNPELFVAVFSEPHTAGHQWLHKETPDHRCYDAALLGAIGSPTRQVYEAVDHAIGKVIEQLSPQTTVLLTCLGGMRVTHGACYFLSDLLVRLGYSVYPTHAAPGDHRFSRRFIGPFRAALRRGRDILSRRRSFESPPNLLFDWSKTRAFSMPWASEGYLRINQRRREPGGIVEKGAEREQVLEQIEAAVRSLRIAGTNKPAAQVVVRAQEQFSGAAADELPDLMVLWDTDHPLEAIESEATGRIENRDHALRSVHNNRGSLLAYGPLITAGPPIGGVCDFDIAPTVLELLGLTAPGNLNGHAISDLIAAAPSDAKVRKTN